MRRRFTLEYWQDGQFYVGYLVEIPSVASQGETLEELRENIQDAYDLLIGTDQPAAPATAARETLELRV